MNIQEAVKESLRTQKIIARKRDQGHIGFIPTNDSFKMVMIVDLIRKRPPGRRWQPRAEDLVADDWYITDKNYTYGFNLEI